MMNMVEPLRLALALSALLVICCGEIVNTKIARTIDISSHVSRVTTVFVASDVVGEYEFSLPLDAIDHLAYLAASVGGEDVNFDATGDEDGFRLYRVSLPSQAKQELKLKLSVVYTGMIKPYPKEIKQLDAQLVQYEDELLVPTPYYTKTQTTKVVLASPKIESYSQHMPVAVKGDTVTYGPFLEAAPPQAGGDRLRVHYTNHAAFAKMTSCLREIEVSNWGNIAVEELYELVHEGAKLKGGFSRLDYQNSRAATLPNSTPSFRDLIAVLPAEAGGIYYRDNIGNISTSSIKDSEAGLKLQLQTRYPMFGGWKTSYYMGYNLPTEAAIRRDGSKFTLEMDFGVPFADVWVEDYTVKVVLPEGATHIVTHIPFDAVEESRTSRFTYLDSALFGGRPVIILHVKNLAREHNVKFTVDYEMQSVMMLREPLLLIASFFSFFLVSMFVLRLDLRIRTSQKVKTT